MTKRSIRLLIAEDSDSVRQHLVRMVESDGRFEIVGLATRGDEAVRMAAELRPQVVSMDIHMPGLNGVEATARIMAECPTPIVVISSSLTKSETSLGFQALRAGALDVILKPGGHGPGEYESVRRQIVSCLGAMSEVKVVRRTPPVSARSDPPRPSSASDPFRSVAIAGICASTGGPPALETILKRLPAESQVPVLVVQHMANGFTSGFASWLESAVGRPVRVASDGQLLRPGEILVAPDDRHLVVGTDGRVRISEALPIRHHRPSGTPLFRSLASAFGSRAVGVLLTGMGCDGADGLLDLRRAGGWTIAQSEESCTIFGMPKAAIDLDAAIEILDLGAIGDRLGSLGIRDAAVGGTVDRPIEATGAPRSGV